MMSKIVISSIIVILTISLSVNIILGFTILNQYTLLKQTGYKKINQNVLEFRDSFLKNIILSDKEVDFDTRLELETSVRNLNDVDILKQWQKFTKSQLKEDVSSEAEKLLNLLIEKTYY